jgi:hypothetical protein
MPSTSSASTVHRIDVDLLGNPVAVTRGEWTFRGQRLYSVDWFFAWRSPRSEPSTLG